MNINTYIIYVKVILMKTYKFLFAINHSSFSVAAPFTDAVGEYEIVIPEEGRETIISVTDLIDIFESTITHVGIQISVVISTLNIQEGAYKAQIRANYIAVILSFICNATISEPILQMGYETTAASDNTEFMQLLYMSGELLKQKRAMEHFDIEGFLKTVMKNNSLEISKAIKWYKKGLSEIDSVDKFMHYWVGLECLNKLLSEELETAPITGKCKNCGYIYKIPTGTGIKAIFDKYSKDGDGKSDYSKCRDLRVQLQHGYGDLQAAFEVADEYAELCRKMLLQGIYFLLQVDQKICGDRHH